METPHIGHLTTERCGGGACGAVVAVVWAMGCYSGHLDTLHSEYYIQILMGLYWVRVFAQCNWWWCCPVGVITNISGQPAAITSTVLQPHQAK